MQFFSRDMFKPQAAGGWKGLSKEVTPYAYLFYYSFLSIYFLQSSETGCWAKKDFCLDPVGKLYSYTITFF